MGSPVAQSWLDNSIRAHEKRLSRQLILSYDQWLCGWRWEERLRAFSKETDGSRFDDSRRQPVWSCIMVVCMCSQSFQIDILPCPLLFLCWRCRLICVLLDDTMYTMGVFELKESSTSWFLTWLSGVTMAITDAQRGEMITDPSGVRRSRISAGAWMWSLSFEGSRKPTDIM